jgi:protein-disulfide isomerase
MNISKFRIPAALAAAWVGSALLGCPASGEDKGGAGAGGAAHVTSAGAASGGAASAAIGDVAASMGGVAAVVDGKEITYADLDAKAAGKLIRLRTQAHELRKQTLDEMIDMQLLEKEAKARGLEGADDLMKAEVTEKAVEPSDEEAQAYFEKNPPRGNVEFDKIKPRIKAFMKRKSEEDLRVALISGLREKAGVQVFFEPLRFDVGFDETDPIHGSKDAPVVIVTFSDFQCPYCEKVVETVHKIQETYGEKVSIVFRDYPLPMHKDAPKAAEAGQCAAEQGKFWEMHDKMFANQQELKPDDLKGFAGELGLDGGKFAECLDSGRHAEEVKADMAAGEAVGVTGTPAFFINGKFLNGARPYDDFKQIIDGELKTKGLL